MQGPGSEIETKGVYLYRRNPQQTGLVTFKPRGHRPAAAWMHVFFYLKLCHMSNFSFQPRTSADLKSAPPPNRNGYISSLLKNPHHEPPAAWNIA